MMRHVDAITNDVSPSVNVFHEFDWSEIDANSHREGRVARRTNRKMFLQFERQHQCLFNIVQEGNGNSVSGIDCDELFSGDAMYRQDDVLSPCFIDCCSETGRSENLTTSTKNTVHARAPSAPASAQWSGCGKNECCTLRASITEVRPVVTSCSPC